MTTSGLSNWNPAVTDLITQALAQIGVIAEDETPTADMYAKAIFQLNAIVSAAQAIGLHVWTEQEAILFLQGGSNGQPGQVRYEIGGPGTNANTSDSDEWLELTLTQSALAGATSISVSSTTGVNYTNYVGIILDNGSTFWTSVQSNLTTESGIDLTTEDGTDLIVEGSALPSLTIPLAQPLPSSASSGNFVLVYSEQISRPLKIPAARLMYLNGLNETPMTIMSRQEYMDTPNKLSPGTPTQWFYTPQRDRGIFYVWPAPVTTSWAIRFTWYRPLQDFFAPGDTMDFPQEWVSPLLWNLAYDLVGMFDVPMERQAYLKDQKATYGDLAISYDRESEPVQFGLSWDAVQGY